MKESTREPKGRDALFSTEADLVEAFRFDESVASVFGDMIQRSVPGYGTILSMIGLVAARQMGRGSVAWDLGCSLGGSTLAMASALPHDDFTIHAVDNSPAMIERASTNLAPLGERVELHLGDIRDVEVEGADLIVLHLTLQFVDPGDRLALLQRLHAGLKPGGLLILSEKLRFDDPDRHERMTDLYYDFKRANGYSELEIAQKRNALEEVMICNTAEEHVERLRAAGFARVEEWFRAVTFASFLAFK